MSSIEQNDVCSSIGQKVAAGIAAQGLDLPSFGLGTAYIMQQFAEELSMNKRTPRQIVYDVYMFYLGYGAGRSL